MGGINAIYWISYFIFTLTCNGIWEQMPELWCNSHGI